jgi:hypothetical protein
MRRERVDVSGVPIVEGSEGNQIALGHTADQGGFTDCVLARVRHACSL